MDKSKEYIKMCDCPEIQKNHNQKIGDRQIDNDSDETNESYIVTALGSLGENVPCYPHEIWLPRQDQLQEMVEDNVYNFVFDFYHFVMKLCRKQKNTSLPSMEQLWLTFTMKEKFNKTWDGEKWT